MRALLTLGFLAVIVSVVHARTWTVEKDGTGDYEIIQDAIDAAASGDTVRVGPGRFDTFRQFTSAVDGATLLTVVWIDKELTLLGAGSELTTLGPAIETLEISGVQTASLVTDGGAPATIRGFTIEKTQNFVGIRTPTVFEDSRVDGTGKDRSAGYGVFIADTSGVEIRNVAFLGPGAILTANSGVGTVIVEDCTFFTRDDLPRFLSRNAISWSALDLQVRGCTFEGSGVAITNTFGGNAIIEDCHLSELVGGIVVDFGHVVARNVTIDRAEQNITVQSSTASIEIYDSELRGGTLWTIDVGGNMLARNCTIRNASDATVRGASNPSPVIDLRENYWGTTDVEQVRSWIIDPSGTVQFEPILLGPVSDDSRSMSSLKSRFLRSN